MAQRIARLILGSFIVCLTTQAGWAYSQETHVYIHRDRTYERDLQWEAGADKAITPARVIRWMMGQRGESSTPSNMEFQPVIHAHDGTMAYLATIVYKF